MKKTFKIIYYLILTVIVLVALLFVASVFPISGNIKILSVLSGSMEPEIHTGSIIVIKPVSDYKIGDIITFGKNTKMDVPTTHRITEERVQDGVMVYTTKGDANNSEDGKEISKKDILGKVYFSVPYLGYAIDLVKKPVGLLIIIVIPAVVVIYDEMQKISREFNKIREKKFLGEKNENDNI